MKRITHITLLAIASILLLIMFFGKVYTVYYPFLILLIICFSISLLNVFLNSRKELQLRLCIYNVILLTALQIWIFYVWISIHKELGDKLYLSMERFPVSTVFPLIAAILTLLALQMIRRQIAAESLLKVLKANKKKQSKKRG